MPTSALTRSPSLVGDLAPRQHDTLLARWRDRELRADAYATFWLSSDGTNKSASHGAGVAFGGLQLDFQDLVLKPLADSAAH